MQLTQAHQCNVPSFKDIIYLLFILYLYLYLSLGLCVFPLLLHSVVHCLINDSYVREVTRVLAGWSVSPLRFNIQTASHVAVSRAE